MSALLASPQLVWEEVAFFNEVYTYNYNMFYTNPKHYLPDLFLQHGKQAQCPTLVGVPCGEGSFSGNPVWVLVEHL